MSLFTLGARLAADARRLATTIKIPKEDAVREIRKLAAFALKLSPAQLAIREREAPGRFDLSPYGIVFDRRLRGEPLMYILGECPFYEHTFRITSDVLIPRPETELLVESVLRLIPETKRLSILELGTGSGCVAISVALARPLCTVTAIDVSDQALDVAKDNATRLGAKNVEFVCSDWYSALAGRRYSLIVSNPPYVAEQDPHLDALRFEPVGALVAGRDGLSALKTVVAEAPSFLDERGFLVVEHGYDQRDAVCQLFSATGFESIESSLDLGGRPRVVLGCFASQSPNKQRRKKSAVSA